MPTFLGCFFSCSTSSRASLILVLSSACSFSLALCLGTKANILRRHSRRSSAVWAFLYWASASRYCGVRLAAMGCLQSFHSLSLVGWLKYSNEGLALQKRSRIECGEPE